MKKLSFVLLALAIAFMPAAAQADTVTVGEWLNVSGGFDTDGGSVFKVQESEGNIFDSFCLELDEYISAGSNQVLGVSQTAYLGGVNTNAGDPISEETAWLYLQFRSGNATYADAFAVQQAIWVLEGELAACPAGNCAAYVTAANNNAAPADLARVFVINFGPVAGATTPQVQDLLTTVPDGGATLMLLGGALMGLGALRRKFRG